MDRNLAKKEWVRDNFVPKEDCNERQEANDKKFANDNLRIALFEQKIHLWETLMKLIATATIGQLVTSVIELIGGLLK